MGMVTKRRASASAKKAQLAALPPLPGWTDEEYKTFTDDMIADLDEVAAGGKSVLAEHGLKIVGLGAWIIANKIRSETWLRMAFARIEKLEAELRKERKAKVLPYRGAWKHGEQYEAGEFVSYQGSVWHVEKRNRSRPGDDPAAYTLAVKRGQAGKGAQP